MTAKDAAAPTLASPTRGGQTQFLVAVDGAAAAAVCWDLLPYNVRAHWQESVRQVGEPQLEGYLRRQASPVGLAQAASRGDLSESLRAIAEQRLGALGVAAPVLARLERHFGSLLNVSRAKLLGHLAAAEKVDHELDRLDLLGEAIALRDLQRDVQAERPLMRAFRGMFAAQRPFCLWILVALTTALTVALGIFDEPRRRAIEEALYLLPSFERPWTLVTYAVLHLRWQHLAINLAAFVLVGQVLEQVLGHGRFVLVWFGCAVAGGVASVAYKLFSDVPYATEGMSGAVAGMAGLALFLGLWFHTQYGRVPMRYAGGTLFGGLLLVSNVILAATSGDAGTDHAAHLGGLAAGLAIGMLLRRTLTRRAEARFARG
jgi:membrane associated rhomboid family serine protease